MNKRLSNILNLKIYKHGPFRNTCNDTLFETRYTKIPNFY